MDTRSLLAAFDRDQRREITYPGTRREAFPHLVRFVRPPSSTSFILYTDLDESNADRVIDEQVAYFNRLRRPFNWKVYAHDHPADLVPRLLERGFEADDEQAVMVLETAVVPPSLLAAPQFPVTRLTDRAQLSDVAAVLETVWNVDFDWVYERMGEHMGLPDYLSVFVAYIDGLPASVGWTYYNSGLFAGLWGGSTVPAYRGRGLYTAVLAARVQEARERGVGCLVIDAGSMSRPILEHHGFKLLTYATDCRWQAPGE